MSTAAYLERFTLPFVGAKMFVSVYVKLNVRRYPLIRTTLLFLSEGCRRPSGFAFGGADGRLLTVPGH